MDLAATLGQRPFGRLVQEAFAVDATTPARLAAAVAGRRGFRGRTRLADLLAEGSAEARSRAERRLARGLAVARLGGVGRNEPIGRFSVDILLADHRLAVEVDGPHTHASPWAQDRDRRKEHHLRRVGLDLVRFTTTQVDEDLPGCVAIVAAAVRANAGRVSPFRA